MQPTMRYPTLEQVNAADHHQLADWYARLRFAETENQTEIFNRIVRRIGEAGFELPAIHRTDVEPEENTDEMEKL